MTGSGRGGRIALRDHLGSAPAREIRTIEETAMADHGEVEYATATGNDYAEHEHTYRFFLRALKWSVTVVVVILIGMAIFLT
jgi:hypothetical protein